MIFYNLHFLIYSSSHIILDPFTATSKEDLLKSIVPPALEDISDVKVEPKDNAKAKNNLQFVITVIPKLCQHNIPLIKSRFALVSYSLFFNHDKFGVNITVIVGRFT